MLILIVLVIAVLIFSFSGYFGSGGGNSGGHSIDLAGVTPNQIYKEDGKTYYLVDGVIYELQGSTLKFTDNLYDPDFYKKNYVKEGGAIYQIDPKDGALYKVVTHFEEGFENAATLKDLFGENRWHNSNVDPDYEGEPQNYYKIGNRVEISHSVVRTGRGSLRAYAKPWKDVSKASIGRGIIYFEKGDDFYFSGWFYMEDTPSIYDGGGMTLFDLESNWMKSAGIRSIFKSGDALAIELKFFGKKTFRQEKGKEIAFPIGKWVHIETHIYLSDENGLVELWQDGVKIVDETGQTLPLKNTVLDKFEVGISAIVAGAKYEKVLYIDDVVISDRPIR